MPPLAPFNPLGPRCLAQPSFFWPHGERGSSPQGCLHLGAIPVPPIPVPPSPRETRPRYLWGRAVQILGGAAQIPGELHRSRPELMINQAGATGSSAPASPLRGGDDFHGDKVSLAGGEVLAASWGRGAPVKPQTSPVPPLPPGSAAPQSCVGSASPAGALSEVGVLRGKSRISPKCVPSQTS